jgi:hypothetical protein
MTVLLFRPSSVSRLVTVLGAFPVTRILDMINARRVQRPASHARGVAHAVQRCACRVRG